LHNLAIAKKTIQKTTGIVTSLHVPEIATLGIQEIPITGEEVQTTNGTNAVTEMAMATTATAKTGIGTMKEAAVMVNIEAIGTNLTGTATRRFFSSDCFIMTGINFRIFKGCSSCGLFCFQVRV
jgi:hypothetical protein